MKLTKEAQEVLNRVNSGEDINDIDLAENWSCSDGFEYGIFEGGYIKPEDILVGEDLEKVKNAIKAVGEFKEIWEKISFEM